MKIKIDHIAKIEGHAGFTADIVNGSVTSARISVLEGARLLEGILRDRKYYEVSHITARICGVCPVVHTFTSLKTLENAMKIETSEQTVLLRELMMLGQIINSHALHIFFFSLSDFFGIKNDLKLIEKFPDKTKQAVDLRDFGNKIIEIIGGRSIHPLTPETGGFTKLPNSEKIQEIREMAKKILPEAIKLAAFFTKLHYPEFERQTEFISLRNNSKYAIYDGDICINGKSVQTIISSFMKNIKEYQIAEDAVNRTTLNKKPYMVGAIARINNNHSQLNPKASKILAESEIKPPSRNPFHNILAQAIEIVHCVEEAIKISKLVSTSLRSASRRRSNLKISSLDCFLAPLSGDPRNDISISAGSGAAAIEAPRGTLFYFYEVGNNGLIKNCNIITPTAQNLARLEEDLKIWLPQLEKQSLKEEEIKNKIRMLIRAYDPCLTCATH